jgi:hypothetical protein
LIRFLTHSGKSQPEVEAIIEFRIKIFFKSIFYIEEVMEGYHQTVKYLDAQ